MRLVILLAILLVATGCYSVVTINIGSVNKQAGSVGKQLPPDIYCAALAEPGQKLDQLQIQALQTCTQTVQKEKKK